MSLSTIAARRWDARVLAGVGVAWSRGLGFLAVVLGIGLVLFFVKPLIGRPRPHHAWIAESGFSFPSAHATATAALWSYVAWLARQASNAWRRIVFPFAIGVPVTIGICRLYLGVHWFSDVIAGWSAGIVIGAFAIAVASFVTWAQTQMTQIGRGAFHY